jgi:hypothetical protein
VANLQEPSRYGQRPVAGWGCSQQWTPRSHREELIETVKNQDFGHDQNQPEIKSKRTIGLARLEVGDLDVIIARELDGEQNVGARIGHANGVDAKHVRTVHRNAAGVRVVIDHHTVQWYITNE